MRFSSIHPFKTVIYGGGVPHAPPLIYGEMINLGKKKTPEKAKTRRAPSSRYWACISYLNESELESWLECTKYGCLAGVISPLHEPDEVDKKPHYHVLLDFGGRRVTMNGAAYVLGDLPANKFLVIPSSVAAYERYLVHYDDLDKQQFYPLNDDYVAGKYCTVFGNYDFASDKKYIMDKFSRLYDLFYNEFRPGVYSKCAPNMEYPAFVRFLRDKYPELLATCIRNSYNVKSAFNMI